jgi:hypothetical protein
MRPPGLLVLLLLAAAAVAAQDGCFNSLFYATPDAVDVAVPIACAGVWQSHQRTVHAAHVDEAAGRATLVASYAGEPGARIERFDMASGARIDSVLLQAAPAVLAAACATEYDVWAATPDGTLLHWDAVSGAARPVSHTFRAAGRVWLACSATRLWASVPSARAVWQLDATDARVERVVARLASPGALAVDRDARLWIIDGQPGVTAWLADVANSTGLRATPLAGGGVVGVAVRRDGAALLLAADGSLRAVGAAGAPQPVELDLAYTPYARALASASHAVRGAGSIVDVHSGESSAPPLSPLANNGNLGRLVHRPMPAAGALRVVDAAGDVALLSVAPPLATCAPLAYAGRKEPLTANGGAGVHVLDMALDGSIVWADAASGIVRVRLASGDAELPALAHGAQVRVADGATPAVCALHDGLIECHDLHTGLAHSLAAPEVDGLVMQWDGAGALALFGVADGSVLNVWRVATPLAFGAAAEWHCALDLRRAGTPWAPAYWGVVPVGDGGFMVRWSAMDALVLDGNCTPRASIDELRADAQPTLALVAGVAGPITCISVNATRLLHLRPRSIAGWIVLSVLLCLCGAAGLSGAAVFVVAPRHVWRHYTMTGGGVAWTRLGAKRRSWRSLCSLNHDVQSVIYGVASWLCPCCADALHARLQRYSTPVVYEPKQTLADGAAVAAAAALPVEREDARWEDIDRGFVEAAARAARIDE